MKLRIIFMLMYGCFLFSCSSKEQWGLRSREKQYRQSSADTHQLDYMLMEWMDSLSHRIQQNVENYETWDLHGNVYIDPDGYLRTDHAEIKIWSNHQKMMQLLDLQKLYREDLNEVQQRTEEESRLQKSIKGKSKRLISLTVFFISLMLIGICFLYIRHRR